MATFKKISDFPPVTGNPVNPTLLGLNNGTENQFPLPTWIKDTGIIKVHANLELVSGSINSTGQEVASTTTRRTGFFSLNDFSTANFSITPYLSGSVAFLHVYEVNGPWLKASSAMTGSSASLKNIDPKQYLGRLVIRRPAVDGVIPNLTDADVTTITLDGEKVNQIKAGDLGVQLNHASVISDTANELMAHCSTTYFDEIENRGNVYMAYYADNATTVESPSNTTTYIAFSKFNLITPQTRSKTTVLSYGETVGSFTQGARAPYDPNILILSNKLYIYFNGFVGGKVGICFREVTDKTTLALGNVTACTLRYTKPDNSVINTLFNVDGIYSCVTDNGRTCLPLSDHMFGARIINVGGTYYSSIGSYGTSQAGQPGRGTFPGLIVKSTDGILWEMVAIMPADWYSMEPYIEIVGNEIYVVSRDNGPAAADTTQGANGFCRFGVYNTVTKTWSNTSILENSKWAKPAIIYHNKRMLIMYNSSTRVCGTDWGTIDRGNITIQEVDINTKQITTLVNILRPKGMHYPFFQIFKGDLYLSFSEDRRGLNNTQVRSNIAYTKLII